MTWHGLWRYVMDCPTIPPLSSLYFNNVQSSRGRASGLLWQYRKAQALRRDMHRPSVPGVNTATLSSTSSSTKRLGPGWKSRPRMEVKSRVSPCFYIL